MEPLLTHQLDTGLLQEQRSRLRAHDGQRYGSVVLLYRYRTAEAPLAGAMSQ